jgi:DNA-directed DNA polymerase III PolC
LPPFVHLHTHSYYSLLEGTPSPAELARAAAGDGQPALALTDHHALTGAVEFAADACAEAGVRPLLGLTLDTARGSLLFLATDLTGWASLCRLSTAAQSTPEQIISLDRLAQDRQGLICLTGGVRGPLSHLAGSEAATFASTLRDLFPDRLYVELQQHSPADREHLQQLVALARSLNLPLVATHSIHYLHPEEAPRQRLLTAIRLNKPWRDLPANAVAPPNAHFLSSAEMATRFADWPEALAATHEIAERCQLTLPLGQKHYPAIPLPPGLTAVEVLRRKAEAGAHRLYGDLTAEIQTRLDYELGIIGERGYAPLFLIMEEILSHARETGVPTSSRGSAASSLVAHCLGLTSPDPIRLNLYFERFLNPARSTPPDIDTDLCSRRRGGVIEYVSQHYGPERVAMVCTLNRFRERSALRETAKAYGLSSSEIKTLTDALPYRGWGGPPSRWQENALAALLTETASPETQAIVRDAQSILGLPRHLSVHPGGVVITPGPMTDLVPTQPAAIGVTRMLKAIRITQFDLDSIERLGLIKIDLLGIRGLTVLGDVADVLYAARPADYASPLAALDAIPEDDGDTEAIVRNGRTIGCFQIESPGMRAILKEVEARSIDDIMVALALYRPGPLTGGLKDSFVRRHLGQEAVQHLHPALGPLLEDTYGVILYQEQVLRIAHGLAGLSLADSDLLRRAMSHFDPGKQMQTLKERFIARAESKSGVPPAIAERVWELMAAFAGYGFPKAHAASYAQVAWRSAWCKAHAPAEFMASVLANWGGFYSQRVYLTEARRMGLHLHAPHINHAQREFSVSRQDGEPHLYMGLDQVKDLTARAQERIIRQRPFRSLQDFLSRVDPRPQEAETLIKVGALEGFGPIATLLRVLKGEDWQAGQMALFESPTADGEDWSLAEKVAAQEELLGVGLVAHPLELMAEAIAEAGALTTAGAAGRVGQRVKVAGMRQTWHRTRTVRGDYIYFMSLEDLEGTLDVVIFSDVYQRHRTALASGAGPFIIEGMLESDSEREEPILRAEKVWRL